MISGFHIFPGREKCQCGQQAHMHVGAPGPTRVCRFHEILNIFKDSY